MCAKTKTQRAMPCFRLLTIYGVIITFREVRDLENIEIYDTVKSVIYYQHT